MRADAPRGRSAQGLATAANEPVPEVRSRNHAGAPTPGRRIEGRLGAPRYCVQALNAPAGASAALYDGPSTQREEVVTPL